MRTFCLKTFFSPNTEKIFALDKKFEYLDKEFEVNEGKKQEAIAIVKEMKKNGLPNSQIAKFTKLSLKEIEELK